VTVHLREWWNSVLCESVMLQLLNDVLRHILSIIILKSLVRIVQRRTHLLLIRVHCSRVSVTSHSHMLVHIWEIGPAHHLIRHSLHMGLLHSLSLQMRVGVHVWRRVKVIGKHLMAWITSSLLHHMVSHVNLMMSHTLEMIILIVWVLLLMRIHACVLVLSQICVSHDLLMWLHLII